MRCFICIISIFFLKPIYSFGCECIGSDNFESKADLEVYTFIALVKIDSIYLIEKRKEMVDDTHHYADMTILELFKGDSLSNIKVSGGNRNLKEAYWTSCDIGIDLNEKWVVFAAKDKEGETRIGFCTISERYSNALGEKNWKNMNGIKELRQLREIFNHKSKSDSKENGINKTYYENGTVEIQEHIKNGLANGERLVNYYDGTLMIKEFFLNGEKSGRSLWYDRKGRIERNFKYKEGHKIDTCYIYWRHNGRVHYERIFDEKGNMLQDLNYRQDGKLKKKSVIDYESNEYVTKNFYDSGKIEFIRYSNRKTYQLEKSISYFESGEKKSKTVYFPENQEKIHETRTWTIDGELTEHYIQMNNKSKIDLMISDTGND